MPNLLRPDFHLSAADGVILLKNSKYPGQIYHMNSLNAFFLSLHDGARNDEDIIEILRYVLGEKIDIDLFIRKFYAEYGRFLIPVEKAESIFVGPWPQYNPHDFLRVNVAKTIKEKRPPAPRFISLYLTNRCTHRCQYCYAQAEHVGKMEEIESDSMSFEMISQIIYDAFDLGVEGILLTGGEPLIFPDVYRIMHLATSLHIFVQMLTKHRIDVDVIKEMDTSLLSIGFSIDTHDELMAYRITATPHYFNDMMQNIGDFNRLNIPFTINMVISKLTIDTIRESLLFFIEKGASCIYTGFYECGENAAINERLSLSAEEKEGFGKLVSELNAMPGLEGKISHANKSVSLFGDVRNAECSTGTKRLSIRFDGKYIYCEKMANDTEIDLGSVYENQLIDEWNAEKLLRYIYPERELYQHTLCGDCEDFENCAGKNSCYFVSKAQHGLLYRAIKEVEDVCIKR